jgi:hypothetical protein
MLRQYHYDGRIDTSSAGTMMASGPPRQRRRESSDRTPAVAAGPNVVDSFFSAGPLLSIAEDVQPTEGVHVPGTAWVLRPRTNRFRPFRVSWADQPRGAEALLATNGPVISRGAYDGIQIDEGE